MAPISDPEVVILITLYNPTGEGGHQGGGIAAPIASQVLTDVLAYLEVKKDQEDMPMENVSIPEVREMNVEEAVKTIKEQGFEVRFSMDEKAIKPKEMKVMQQFPLPGIQVMKGSTIELEVE